MKIPTLAQAQAYIDEAEQRNPGPWVPHSANVAIAAKIFAGHLEGLDPENAYVIGLLHDIGRREGVTGMRHVYDGYQFLMEEGFPDAARYAFTHSFPVKDIRAGSSKWDCTPEEMKAIRKILEGLEFNDYDRLFMLCDSISLPEGFCTLEKRWVDVLMRYRNYNEFTIPKWQGFYAIQKDFETRMGCSIYSLLPDLTL